ncbi:hypothetical protein ACWGSE_20120 [Streptomyces diastaticus]|uniref:hypothetical protein n=1 Tax=Streptomyces diastaticus TaxID=1956 RepID=UPI00379A8766
MTPPDDLDDTGLPLTAEPDAPGTLGLRLAGSLDHESADALVRAVARHLETPPPPGCCGWSAPGSPPATRWDWRPC